MLYAGLPSGFAFSYDNFGANPSNTYGTSVIPGASHAEGAWTQIASAANIAQNIWWIELNVHSGATSAATKAQLLDIGVDPAGGTAYSAVISNIVVGSSQTPNGGGGYAFAFPLFIPAGSTVAARAQGEAATAGTIRVAAKFYGQRTKPEAFPVGFLSETVGTISTSDGVSFTPGNAADGTWTLLGATTLPCWWWQLAVQISNSNTSASFYYFDLAYGDASNKHLINRLNMSTTSTEAVLDMTRANLDYANAARPIPVGTNLYVRGRCNTTPNTGWSAVAIGVA